MKIGIIGAGNIGANLARLFVKAGHEVAISNSRGPDSLRTLVGEIGPGARALTPNDAAAFGEIVFLAIPWRKPEGQPTLDGLRGRIGVDAMDP